MYTFARQDNSKSRILLAGIRQHISHFRISNSKLRPSHYLSHGSLTPASSCSLCFQLRKKWIERHNTWYTYTETDTNTNTFFTFLDGQTCVFTRSLTRLCFFIARLQDWESPTRPERRHRKGGWNYILRRWSHSNHSIQRSNHIRPRRTTSTPQHYASSRFTRRCKWQELDLGLPLPYWPLLVMVRVARVAIPGS